MGMIVIENYYPTTTMHENMDWMKLTHLESIFFDINLMAPLLHIYLYFKTSKMLIKCTHQRTKSSLLCKLRTLKPQIIPLLTLTLV